MRSTQILSNILLFSTLTPQLLAAPAPLPLPQDPFADLEKQIQDLQAQFQNAGGNDSSASSSSSGGQTFSQVTKDGQTVTNSGPDSSSAGLKKRRFPSRIDKYINVIRKKIEEQQQQAAAGGSGVPIPVGTPGNFASAGNGTNSVTSNGPGAQSATVGNQTGTTNKMGGRTSAFASNGTDNVTSSGPGESSASVGQDSSKKGQSNGQGNNGNGNGMGNGIGNGGQSDMTSTNGNNGNRGDNNRGGPTFSSASNDQDTVTDSGPGSSSASVGFKRRFMA